MPSWYLQLHPCHYWPLSKKSTTVPYMTKRSQKQQLQHPVWVVFLKKFFEKRASVGKKIMAHIGCANPNKSVFLLYCFLFLAHCTDIHKSRTKSRFGHDRRSILLLNYLKKFLFYFILWMTKWYEYIYVFRKAF